MYILIILGILLIGIVIILTLQLRKYEWMKIKLEKGQVSIEDLLKEKEKCLVDYIDVLEGKDLINKKDFVLSTSDNIKEQDKILKALTNEINKLINNHEKILEDKEVKEINKKLYNINLTLNSHKKYYNENVNYYNNLLKSFPSNIVGKILHYQEKEYLTKDLKTSFKILDDEKEKSQ